jgi:flagellar biosynthesis protein
MRMGFGRRWKAPRGAGKKRKMAVALRCDQDKESAPRVVASGRGRLAEKIIQTAEQSQIPVFADPVLVDMLSNLDLNSEIPEELYKMVAEVLVFIYSLDNTGDKK